MPLNDNTLFSFDSSSLIHAWNRAYRPKNFPSFWLKLEECVSSGLVVASVEVLNELSKKDDDVHAWCKARAGDLCVEVDDAQQEHMQHIMGTYPRLVDTVKGKSGGDPFVIALARVRHGKIIVVSEEDNGRKDSPRIPDVCRAEQITCYKLADFIEHRGWSF
ncbi:DUF4411 family protein [Piscinibacter sp.]|uniref:DUF4411 family protein n=1 Tax=Piscinibacter sp. TaxID=1903157 RepID=UPI0039E6C04C